MFRYVLSTLAATFLAGVGLWSADVAPVEKPRTTDTPELSEAPKQVLPTGALIFSIRPAQSQVMVNRLATPQMSAWMVGQELMTEADQYAHLLLSDRTVMTLGPQSNAVLQQEPLVATGANKTTIQLRRGSLQVATSKLAVTSGFCVSTPVGDAVAVGTDYNVELASKDGTDEALIRVRTGLVHFQMNGQSYPIQQGERRLFSHPTEVGEPELQTEVDLESQLELLTEEAKGIRDEQLRSLLTQTVSVTIRVKKGRVAFVVNDQEYAITEGQKRIISQPAKVSEPEELSEADYLVMMRLMEEVAKKVKVLPGGAMIFEIESEGDKTPKVLVDGSKVRSMSKWKVGQELATGDKQYAHLILAERTLMVLGPKSRLTFEQQTPNSSTGANAIKIHLSEGSLQVKTLKIAEQTGFRVGTPLGEAVAMGTDFHIQVLLGGLLPRVIPSVGGGRGGGGGGGSIIIPRPLSP